MIIKCTKDTLHHKVGLEEGKGVSSWASYVTIAAEVIKGTRDAALLHLQYTDSAEVVPSERIYQPKWRTFHNSFMLKI